MKTVFTILALALTLTSTAKAELITCNQTEPFITETYNVEKGTLTIHEGMSDSVKVLRNLKLVIKAEGRFEIRDSANKTIRVMILSGKGSDGMSEIVYPFEGTDVHGNMGAGCESTELPSKKE